MRLPYLSPPSAQTPRVFASSPGNKSAQTSARITAAFADLDPMVTLSQLASSAKSLAIPLALAYGIGCGHGYTLGSRSSSLVAGDPHTSRQPALLTKAGTEGTVPGIEVQGRRTPLELCAGKVTSGTLSVDDRTVHWYKSDRTTPKRGEETTQSPESKNEDTVGVQAVLQRCRGSEGDLTDYLEWPTADEIGFELLPSGMRRWTNRNAIQTFCLPDLGAYLGVRSNLTHQSDDDHGLDLWTRCTDIQFEVPADHVPLSEVLEEKRRELGVRIDQAIEDLVPSAEVWGHLHLKDESAALAAWSDQYQVDATNDVIGHVVEAFFHELSATDTEFPGLWQVDPLDFGSDSSSTAGEAGSVT